jgi:lysophospholipase L1-like esterase
VLAARAYRSRGLFPAARTAICFRPMIHLRHPFCLKVCATALVVFALSVMTAGGSAEAAQKKGKAGKGSNVAKGPDRWEEAIKKFEAADAATPPAKGAVLLVGGSNARRWTDVGDYFPQQRVINRGFGGAHLTDVLHFADRIVVPYAPKTILINAGGNDLASGKTPEQIRDAAKALVAKIRAALPETRICFLAVPPVLRAGGAPESMAAIRALNGRLAEVARAEKKVEFVDLFAAFLDDKDQPRAELFVADGTHFSPPGYAIVAGLLRGKL